jgi:hypothetical protein
MPVAAKRSVVPALLAALASFAPPSAASPAGPAPVPGLDRSPQALAELIDRTLAQEWKVRKLPFAESADDAAWLRRLSLDLCGTIPEREEVAAFLADDREDKRARKIDEYLADRACAQNLSYLWSNALLSGAQRGSDVARLLRPWLEEQFARNVPFADVVRDLIGGTGRTDQNGGSSFVLAYADDIEALASVTARSILGVQIQCAQCHDHPYDRWKQSDFNGFAGFFLGMRANRVSEMPPVFELSDLSTDELRRDQVRRLIALLRRQRMDPGEPGEMSETVEARAGEADPGEELLRRLRKRDDSPGGDERIEEAFEKLLATLPPAQRERVEKARERLKNFRDARFLDGSPYRDRKLLGRRAALAEWVVAPENPWFAQAVVNRLWAHFFGKGLVEPVDDLTGSQDRILPQLLSTIAQQFVQSGTDLRYLLSAFARTRAYSLGNSLERDAEGRAEQERWFAAHPLRPFTAEQVLHSLLRATATDEKHVPRERGEEFERERARLLERFRYVFADDEGGDADRFASSIPQALFLMNGRMTNDEITLRRSRMLDEILDESRADRERLRQIFQATVNRPPTQREAEKLGRLVRGASGGSRRGIEDLYWALLNSTEFLTNH